MGDEHRPSRFTFFQKGLGGGHRGHLGIAGAHGMRFGWLTSLEHLWAEGAGALRISDETMSHDSKSIARRFSH